MLVTDLHGALFDFLLHVESRTSSVERRVNLYPKLKLKPSRAVNLLDLLVSIASPKGSVQDFLRSAETLQPGPESYLTANEA